RLVRARPQPLVLAADLAPGPHDAAGEGEDHAGHGADRGDRRLGRRQRRGLRLAEDQEVPAADALDRAEHVLAEELAVPRRHPPVPLAVEQIADLPAVADEPQHAAYLGSL